MNIKARLIMINILFLVGIGAVLGIMSFYHYRQVRFDRLVLQAHQFRSSIHRANSKLKDTLVGDEFMDEWGNFVNAHERMESDIRTLIDSGLYTNTVESVEGVDDRSAAMKNVLERNAERVDEIGAAVDTLDSRYPDYLPGLIKASNYYDDPEIDEQLRRVKTLSIYFSDNLESLVGNIISDIERGAEVRQGVVKYSAYAVSAGIIIAVALSSLFILVLLKRRLDGIRQELTQLSSGDFTHTMEERTKDELSQIARAIHVFIHEYSSIIRQIQELSERSGRLEEEVTDASNESAAAVSESPRSTR